MRARAFVSRAHLCVVRRQHNGHTLTSRTTATATIIAVDTAVAVVVVVIVVVVVRIVCRIQRPSVRLAIGAAHQSPLPVA